MQTQVCRLHAERDLRLESIAVGDPGVGEVRVRIKAGGICGSDLHYYQHGGTGTARLLEPLILGHEIAGVIEAVGPEVDGLELGSRVALNPSMPCGTCEYCEQEVFQLCVDKRFYGSGSRVPHEQGAFRELLVAQASQCQVLADSVSLAAGACAEPLAVALHVCNHVGELAGKRVLITGSGPIGCVCAAVARHAGALEVVVTDLEDFPLGIASQLGATAVINVRHDPDQFDYVGPFDIAFECTGVAAGVQSAFAYIRPQGHIVQVGIAGDLPVPVGSLVRKEVVYHGTYRFYPEYAQAVELLNRGAIDLTPMITQTFPLADAVAAFELAGDRTQAVKVMLEL